MKTITRPNGEDPEQLLSLAQANTQPAARLPEPERSRHTSGCRGAGARDSGTWIGPVRWPAFRPDSSVRSRHRVVPHVGGRTVRLTADGPGLALSSAP